MLSFDEIRAKVEARRAFEDVNVPSLGGSVRVAKLGAEKKISLGIRYQQYARTPDGKRLANPDDTAEFNTLLVAASVVDEQGKLIFDSAVGRVILNGLEPDELMTIANQAVVLNGMDKDDPLDDAKKNLSDHQTGSLPLPSADS